jgi:hypothetical protein
MAFKSTYSSNWPSRSNARYCCGIRRIYGVALIEDFRDFLSDWTLAIASLLGLIAVWNSTKDTINKWIRNINLYRRMAKVESEVEQLQTTTHLHANSDLKEL